MTVRRRLRVAGQVQGVGFRPWVVRTARALQLTGWVRNAADGVWVEVQGEGVDRFVSALREAPAPIAVEVLEDAVIDSVEEQGFSILASEASGDRIPTLPPDLATCSECLRELASENRRHGYALLSCTACGPRYSIAGAPPFDRERTAMVAFPLCEACAVEYEEPSDRRYHAQATSCAACGPQLSMSIEQAAAVLREGRILAVKGLAGFQLLCDATDPDAVEVVRARKRRPDKPLAVLVDRGVVPEAGLGSDAPIVLCEVDLPVAPAVGRGVAAIGLMRPSTGVHHLLLQAVGRPLVCTSANRSGEPLATRADQVGQLADAVLDHDRDVWRGADDSVVRVMGGRVRVLRRARGFAPRPVALGRGGPPVLAVGADLKSTVALGLGDQAVLSPHLGGLGSRAMLERLEAEIDSLCTVYGVEPEAIAADLHPDLVSRRVADELADRWGVPLIGVQHHHAHIAAVCAEHGLDGAVGLAWDGVGAGPDGTVWGGEVLRVGPELERLGHLFPFALPGGDACARQPGRTALALLHGAGLPMQDLHPQAETLWRHLDALPRTCTAMGRLFDGVAVLAGLDPAVSYEAQLPILFEQAASSGEPYPMDEPLDWRPWVRGVVRDRRDGVPLSTISARFHATLAVAMERVLPREGPVVVGGGCFQNRLLVEAALALATPERPVYAAVEVPPGDGGISLGQLWVARRRVTPSDED